jgi:hypothetical protein
MFFEKYAKRLKGSYYVVDASRHAKDSKLINELATLAYDYGKVAYKEYRRKVKDTWSLKKCGSKISREYPFFFCHINERKEADFILCISKFHRVGSYGYFAKLGFFDYSLAVSKNKALRNRIFKDLMGLLDMKSKDRHGNVFISIPLNMGSMRWFGMKYGKFRPISDFKLAKALIKSFGIQSLGEPRLERTTLKDKHLAEMVYETHWKPLSMFIRGFR